MRGTEKQINWATELVTGITTTIDEMIISAKANPRYESVKAQADTMIAMWEDRKAKLNACMDAGYVIDFFRGFKKSANLMENLSVMQSIYKISANNGYAFK